MLRRIASILFIAIALVSFAAISTYSQDNDRHERRHERREYVEHRHEHRHIYRRVYRHEHRDRNNKIILKGHSNKTDIKVKVNF